MFGFEYWSDIFLEHYVFSVLISFLIIVVTLFITKVYGNRYLVKSLDSQVDSKNPNSEMHDKVQPMPEHCLKKSPALVAEKVIEANMTDEQRQHEYEVRQKQLSQIYQLMQKQTEKFGNISLSEIEEQFKLYQ